MHPPLAPTHTKGGLPPPLAPAFGPTRITPSKPPLSLGAAAQPATPTSHRGRPTYTLHHLARTASAASDSPSLDQFEDASASVLRKWGMLKETEDESESSDDGTDELVNVLDSAADLRVQPADKQATPGGAGVPISGDQAETQPVHEVMPSPCMPSPPKTRLATPKQTSSAAHPLSKKKRSMAWICCKASPTKTEYEGSGGDVSKQGAPRLERLSNGDTFKGQYAEGVRQGHAVYRFANGDLYEGQFAQNRMQGCGVYTFAREGRFAGQVLPPPPPSRPHGPTHNTSPAHPSIYSVHEGTVEAARLQVCGPLLLEVSSEASNDALLDEVVRYTQTNSFMLQWWCNCWLQTPSGGKAGLDHIVWLLSESMPLLVHQ